MQNKVLAKGQPNVSAEVLPSNVLHLITKPSTILKLHGGNLNPKVISISSESVL